jgi:hypothetical protein
MKFLRERSTSLLILGLLLVGTALRTFMYGDLRLSVGNAETGSYIASSVPPLFSWESFAGSRLFTTNLLYKLANNAARCQLTAISSPAEGREVQPALQPCFDRIALLQNLLSIFGWCFLAWTTSRLIRHPAAKVGSVILVLTFGFTPQIAEWDGILSPESLSVSLFVVSFALLELIAFQVAFAKRRLDSRLNIVLVAAWLIVFALWALVRDVHLYAIVTTIVLLAGLLVFGKLRQWKILSASIVFLMGVFVIGYYSARDSRRATRYPLDHAFETYILPYPTRVEFFARMGMPSPASPQYQAWLDDNATRTYAAFLMLHPRFVLTTLSDNLFDFRASFVQQYFRGLGTANRDTLLAIGEFLHPETNTVYLLDILLFAGLCISAFGRRGVRIGAWTWLMAWFILGTAVVLLASFFGDTEGFRRHLFPSVESLRLLLWCILFVYLDEIFTGSESPEVAIPPRAPTR